MLGNISQKIQMTIGKNAANAMNYRSLVIPSSKDDLVSAKHKNKRDNGMRRGGPMTIDTENSNPALISQDEVGVSSVRMSTLKDATLSQQRSKKTLQSYSVTRSVSPTRNESMDRA